MLPNNKIIDDPYELLDLNREKLDEKLLDPKYNNANLRELVRKLLQELYSWKTFAEYKDDQVKQLKADISYMNNPDKGY